MSKQIKLLMLEDRSEDADLILYELEKSKLNILPKQVDTKEDFIAALNDFKPDIIIADYMLPTFTGLEALGIVIVKNIMTPFIIVSGTIGEDLAVEAIKFGATDYVLKQNLNRLAPSIKRALNEADVRIKMEKAEKLIQEREENFQSIFQTAPNLIMILNKEKNIVICNDKIKKYLGYDFDEILGKGISEFIHPENLKSSEKCFQEIYTAGVLFNKECRMIRKDGSVIDISINSSVYKTADEKGPYTICIFDDITEQKKAFESINYLATFPELNPHPITEIDEKQNIIYINPAAKKLFPDLLESGDRHLWLEGIYELIKIVMENENVVKYREVQIGSIWYKQALNYVKINNSIRIYGTDITEQKQKENEIKNINRLYAFLSEINQIIVRVHDTQQLFDKTCNIAVDIGGFGLAWIGILDDTKGRLKPASHAGATGSFFNCLNIMQNEKQIFKCPITAALQENRNYICNNISDNDAETTQCRTEIIRLGFHSMISFPIKVFGKVIGTINLYSSVPDFFNEKELLLLDELVTDISFALEYIDQEKKKKLAEELLENSRLNLIKAQRIGKIGSWEWIPSENKISWSDEMYNIFGITPGTALTAENSIQAFHPDDREKVEKLTIKTLETKIPQIVECRVLKPDGGIKYVRGTGEVILDDKGNLIRMLGIYQDITEQKQTEINQQMAAKILEKLNSGGEINELIKDILTIIKEEAGFDAVGIRISDGEDYPFFEHIGFTKTFIKNENSLCSKNSRGEIVRDADGKIVFECICGLVLSGRTDSSFPNFSKDGSFWTNSSSEILKILPENDPRNNPRNQCIHSGYQSVALIPLKTGNNITGLLQLNDKRENHFNPEMIEYFENLALNIALGFARIKAESMLKESEERYRMLFDQIADPVVVMDPDTMKIIEANTNLLTVFGYSREEVIGMPINEIDINETKKQAIDHGKMILDMDYDKFETQMKTKSGTLIDIEVNAKPFLFKEKLAILAIWRDITRRKLAEMTLKESEERYSQLLEIAPVGIAVHTDGYIVYANPAGIRLIGGKSPDQIIGKPIKEIIHPDNLRSSQERIKQMISGVKGLYPVEDMYIRIDGKPINVEVTAALMYYKNKPSVQVIIFDISERKKNEKELTEYRNHLEELVDKRTKELEKINFNLSIEVDVRRKTEENLKKERTLLFTLIDTLPDQIYVKDRECRFITANKNVISALDKKHPDEITGKTDFDLLDKDSAEQNYNEEQIIIQTGNPIIDRIKTVKFNDGSIQWLSITKVPLKNEKGKIAGIVGINRNMTLLKYAEDLLQKSKEQAESANRAKSLFIANMSHEIRTPMNAILGFAQLMLHDTALTVKQKEQLDSIIRSGEHLLALINDILEISKIEAGHFSVNFKTFNLNDLLDDINNMFELKIKDKEIEFEIIKQKGLIQWIVTDQNKLRQIFINLINNAVKFTDKGKITVRIDCAKQKNNDILLTAEVEDTGIGISDIDKERVFLPFEQTEEGLKAGGTGIGLALSRQFALFLGGNISVKSKTGPGTCFALNIIVSEGKKDDFKYKTSNKQIKGLKKGRNKFKILVADDNLENRKFLSDILLNTGFIVLSAENGLEAVSLYKEFIPDLILMDLNMSIMNGYEASKNIKKLAKKNIKIIAVTASAFTEEKNKIFKSGFDGLLIKPFKELDLFDVIKSHLNVEYEYENEKPVQSEISSSDVVQTINELPNELINKIIKAIKNLELKELLKLLNNIEKKSPETAAYLSNLARKYQYDRLLEFFSKNI